MYKYTKACMQINIVNLIVVDLSSDTRLCFNPLTPMLAVTRRTKTHPHFPVLAITGHKRACEDNSLSYPP